MWLRDSNLNGLSMSALSLADMFRSINEAAPLQSNIVIDACESGGLIQDLGALLKPGLLGNVGSPGLTLLAKAAQDQGAAESPAGDQHPAEDCEAGFRGFADIARSTQIRPRRPPRSGKLTLLFFPPNETMRSRIAPVGLTAPRVQL